MRILFTDGWRVYREDTATGAPRYDKEYSSTGEGLGREVSLPHDHTVTEAFCACGTVCYEKRFTPREEWRDKRVEIEFMGVAGSCTVLLNGTAVASSLSDNTPFYADISDVLLFGGRENVITVRVQKKQDAALPGGGITRKVYLSVRERVSVLADGVYISPRKISASRWEIPIEVEVENKEFCDVTAKVSTGIFDREGSLRSSVTRSDVVIPARSLTKLCYTIEIFDNPRVWDIDTPYLYSAVTRVYADGVMKDEVQCRFGFRTVELTTQGVLLNGRRVELHGVCGTGDFAITGTAARDSIDRQRVRYLRELGANAYRMKGAMPSDAMLDAFDACGIFTLVDITADNSSSESIRAACRAVRHIRNHPSVLMWNLSAGAPDADVGERVAASLAFEIKRLDPERKVGAAITLPTGACSVCEVSDAVISPGGVATWDALHASHPEKPFLVSEYGAEPSTRGWYYRDSKEYGCYSEYQAPKDSTNGREYAYKSLGERSWIIGAFIASESDSRKSATPCAMDFSGLSDLYLSKKDSYYYVKSCFDGEPTVHILPHWNMQGRGSAPVQVYTNCHSVELFLNGKSLGKQTPDTASHAEWCVDFTPGSLAAVGYAEGGVPIAADEKVTTGAAVALSLHCENEGDIDANGEDIALIYCTATDENGNAVPDAECTVSFVAEGGDIIGSGSGVFIDAPHPSPRCNMVRGRALCAVRPTEGEVTVYASAPGLLGAYIKISLPASK